MRPCMPCMHAPAASTGSVRCGPMHAWAQVCACMRAWLHACMGTGTHAGLCMSMVIWALSSLSTNSRSTLSEYCLAAGACHGVLMVVTATLSSCTLLDVPAAMCQVGMHACMRLGQASTATPAASSARATGALGERGGGWRGRVSLSHPCMCAYMREGAALTSAYPAPPCGAQGRSCAGHHPMPAGTVPASLAAPSRARGFSPSRPRPPPPALLSQGHPGMPCSPATSRSTFQFHACWWTVPPTPVEWR